MMRQGEVARPSHGPAMPDQFPPQSFRVFIVAGFAVSSGHIEAYAAYN